MQVFLEYHILAAPLIYLSRTLDVPFRRWYFFLLTFFIYADNFRWKEQVFFISKMFQYFIYKEPFIYVPTKIPGCSVSQEVYSFIHLLRALDVLFPRKFICCFLYLRGQFICGDSSSARIPWILFEKNRIFIPRCFNTSPTKNPSFMYLLRSLDVQFPRKFISLFTY